mmetsp:Transcript_67477/g.197359  ORF Transcript_67477/g.197359 Transcript_67477/m.197359 type:complete len:466 (+) Transcript_67477:83-1480(+)
MESPAEPSAPGSSEQWARRYAAGLGEAGEPPGRHEWHVSYELLKPLLRPHLERAAAAAPGQLRILDVGCGTSTLGLELLADQPEAELLLVDLEPLAGALARQHEGDGRVRVLAEDCRSLEAVEDGSAAVVLDKGTLDAMDSAEDTLRCLHAMARKLQRPHGVLVSVSFATASRVLLLQREAAALGLEVRVRIVPAEKEMRLVALAGVSLAAMEADELTKRHMDRLLYTGPLWGEQVVHFEHPALPGRLSLEQLPGAEGGAARSRAAGDDSTGFFVWPAARALSAYLAAHPELVKGRRVAELGAGAGLVGLAAAALGAEEAVLTDLPGTLPLLQQNVELNAEVCGGRARAVELRWGAQEGPGSELADFDVVIGCELIYRLGAEVYEALVQTMVRLAGAGGLCLFVVECRDGMVDDMEFFDRVNERFDVEATSLAPYGYGLSGDDDEDGRLLYTYRPWGRQGTGTAA